MSSSEMREQKKGREQMTEMAYEPPVRPWPTQEPEAEVGEDVIPLSEMTYSRGWRHREQARAMPTGENEARLFLWLLHHPLQRTEDIAIGIKVGYWTAYRLLQSFMDRGLVEYVTPSLDRSMTARWYYLTSEGVRAAAAQEHADPRLRAHAWNADEAGLLHLLPRFHTLLEMQEFVNGLMVHADRVFAGQHNQPFHLSWSWTRDYHYGFTFHLRDAQCSADAALAFRVKGTEAEPGSAPSLEEWRSLFLFVDLGQAGFMSKELITQRLANLLRYRESEERIPYRVFPAIVVLVHSPRQQEIWMQCAREVITSFRRFSPSVRPLLGAIVCLPPRRRTDKEKIGTSSTPAYGRKNTQYLTESPWRLTWKSLDSGEFCPLQKVLVPMSEEALPPGIRARRSDEVTDSPKNKRAIVVGNFTRRAAEISLAKGSPSHEREVVALLGLRVAQRYYELFLQVYVTPLMNAKELGLVIGHSRRIAHRYLAELEDWGLVQHVCWPGGRRWMLTDRGLRYLAAAQHVSILHLKEPTSAKNAQAEQRGGPSSPSIPQRSTGMLLKHLRHTAGVYSVIGSFYEAAQSHPGSSVRWWETGKRCERRYLLGEKENDWHNFRPDAQLEYEIAESSVERLRFLLWVEWDEGTMNARNLKEKLATYDRYVSSGEWRASLLQKVPLLLVIVPRKSQLNLFVGAAQSVLTQHRLFIRVTTAARLAAHGPLAAIWTPIWPKLASEDRRALFDLSEQED